MHILLLISSHCVSAAAKQPPKAKAEGKDGDKNKEDRKKGFEAKQTPVGYDGKERLEGKHAVKNNEDRNKEARSTRTVFYGSAIIGTLLLGYVWSRCLNGTTPFAFIALLALFLHIPAQFLPWLAKWTFVPWLARGQADCTYGLPWEWHLSYAIVFAAASPFLAQSSSKPVQEKGRIPIILLGGEPFHVYNYCSTLLAAFDQYSDCSSAALAFSCGWDKAWLMASTLVASYVAQFAAASLASGFLGGLQALAGVNTEAVSLHKPDNWKVHAILSVVKFVTEIVPQSILSIAFALEVKPNKFIWASVGLSLAMGIKSFATGVHALCRHSYGALSSAEE